MHPYIYIACAGPNGIDAATYERLHTSIDLAGLLDLIEMKAVLNSWGEAERMNTEERQARGYHR